MRYRESCFKTTWQEIISKPQYWDIATKSTTSTHPITAPITPCQKANLTAAAISVWHLLFLLYYNLAGPRVMIKTQVTHLYLGCKWSRERKLWLYVGKQNFQFPWWKHSQVMVWQMCVPGRYELIRQRISSKAVKGRHANLLLRKLVMIQSGIINGLFYYQRLPSCCLVFPF